MKTSYLFVVLYFFTCSAGYCGAFTGTFEFRWLSEPQDKHRVMQLLSEVSFSDDAGKIWTVPTGAKIDGASIPKVLWTYAGSPFVGNYRRASVIHDYHCEVSLFTGNEIHKMFHEAMLTDGVGRIEAWTKYLAVLAYGNTPLGSCGKKISALDWYNLEMDLPSMQLPEGALVQLMIVQDQVNKGIWNPENNALFFNNISGSLVEFSDVSNPAIYQAAVAYRLEPTQDRLMEVENAISAEGASDLEIEQAILLALATVPESD